jgi:hypothetical protein
MKLSLVLFIWLATTPALAQDPLRIVGPTTASADMAVVRDVRHVVVHRAQSGGWTYNHHVDLGAWKGRLYVAWDSCEKDEDVGVSRELYATSTDGAKWSRAAQLFPQGLSTALRMYFFVSPNGRMLAIAGLRTSSNTVSEAKKAGLIVREIREDHSLGEVYTLRAPVELNDDKSSGARSAEPTSKGHLKLPAHFTSSSDVGFVESCRQLLANKPFLEQQDYGRLLDERRMKWHDINNWPASEPSREYFQRFGKGMCFYHRADGALVGVMKWGWVIASVDEGETWTQPVRPKTLVAGMAKIWGQRTPNGKYVLLYNPDLEKRYPLVMILSDDGATFGNMQIVNDQVPPIRFPGLYKVPGPQYVRGISEWSSDGSWKDDVFWVAYSMGKEDIMASRVPLP